MLEQMNNNTNSKEQTNTGQKGLARYQQNVEKGGNTNNQKK